MPKVRYKKVESLITIIAAAGIPSAICGLMFRRLEKKMDEKEKARELHEYFVIKSINASMALGEATAEAVQRIPDAHCNGDMHKALEYAREVKHEQKDFLNKQAVHAIM